MSPLGLKSAKKKAAAATAAPATPAAPAATRGVVVEKPRPDVYTVLLILSLVAIVIGCVFLYLEMRVYDFTFKPRV
jgi:hypothetical protein